MRRLPLSSILGNPQLVLKWWVILAVMVTARQGEAGSASLEQTCVESSAVVLCRGERCGFYRCRDVKVLEEKAREEPVLTRGVGGGSPGYVGAPMRWWGGPEERFLPRAGPIFIIPWQQPERSPLTPREEAELEQRLARPHVPLFLFPTEPEFAAWFAERGLVPEEISLPVPLVDYQRLVTGPGRGPWAEQWRGFIRTNPLASRKEVWTNAAKLCLDFEILGPPVRGMDVKPRPKVSPVDDTRVHPEKWTDEEREKVDAALGDCARAARSEVLNRLRQGREPSQAECLEQVEVDRKGQPVTLAMKLGLLMHVAALNCTARALGHLRPGKFSLEPRYHFDREKGVTTWLSPQEVEALVKQGRGDLLLGTLVPDVITHTGDPTRIYEVYDFKFPCVNKPFEIMWRKYPPSHPYKTESQHDIYSEAFKKAPIPVTPLKGAIR